jgi:hypothetical protein
VRLHRPRLRPGAPRRALRRRRREVQQRLPARGPRQRRDVVAPSGRSEGRKTARSGRARAASAS